MGKERRDKGDGSVYQCSTGKHAGKWIAQISDGYYQNGKRKYVRRHFDTQREAKAGLKELLRLQEDSGKVFQPTKISVGQYLEEWLKEIQASRRPTTYELYHRRLHLHVLPHIGQIKLKELTPLHMQQLVNRMSSSLSPATVKNIVAALSGAFSRAVDWDWINKNPARRLSIPSNGDDGQTEELYTQEQTETLLKGLLSPIKGGGYAGLVTYYALVAASLTGLRIGEVLALKWENIDWASGTIQVTGTVTRIRGDDGLYQVGPPKTKSSRRTLPIPGLLHDYLESWSARQSLWAGENNEWRNQQGLVFTRPDGRIMDPNTIHLTIKRVQRRLGLPELTFHALGRKTFTTRLIRAGLNIKQVSQMLGHTDTSITTDVYLQVLDEDRREAAAAIDEAMSPILGRDVGEAKSHPKPH